MHMTWPIWVSPHQNLKTCSGQQGAAALARNTISAGKRFTAQQPPFEAPVTPLCTAAAHWDLHCALGATLRPFSVTLVQARAAQVSPWRLAKANAQEERIVAAVPWLGSANGSYILPDLLTRVPEGYLFLLRDCGVFPLLTSPPLCYSLHGTVEPLMLVI